MMSGFRDNFCWDCLAGSSVYCCSFSNSEAWLFPQHHLSSLPAQSPAPAKSQCVPAGLLALSVASVITECLCLGRERVPAGWLEFCVQSLCTAASKILGCYRCNFVQANPQDYKKAALYHSPSVKCFEIIECNI